MLKLLKEAAIWFGCSLVAVCLALTGWGQPILAGVATVPVTTAVNDPYARIVVSTIFFVGMVWLMVKVRPARGMGADGEHRVRQGRLT
jgi:hypothetical protein